MIEVNPRVKDALRSGAYRKNYRINVLNDDGTTDFTLNNTELVSESVKIDERMCSGDTLKFGLCEGSSIEFQYFNHDNINHPNIRGRRIQVFVDVQYKDEDGEIAWEPIPLGYFDIQECSTQFSTGIIKAIGYNKLRSDYLDEKANILVEESLGTVDTMRIDSLLRLMLTGYRIEENYSDVQPVPPASPGFPFPIINPYISCTGSKDIYMKQYGVSSPLNYYQYGGGAWNFATVSNVMVFESDDNDLFLNFKKGSFVEFERTVYNFLRDALDRAEFIDANGDPVSGQEILDDICENANFATIVGISAASGERTLYSTIQWEYEVNHGITPHKVAGNANDAIATLTSAEVIYPYSYGLVNDAEPLIALNREVSYNGENLGTYRVYEAWKNYKYYLNAQLDLSDFVDAPILTVDGWQYTMDINDIWSAYIQHNTGMNGQIVTIPDMSDFTLREIQSAVYETTAEFGQLSRTTDLFGGVQLSRDRLFPSDDLYPSDTLYPQGVVESSFRSQYSKLWTDSVGVQTFRNLYITYKTLVDDGQGNLREQEVIMSRVVNADGTTDYYCDDNWLFKNLIWTEQQVGDYADAMVLKMRGIKWFPFEMWAAGLPYIEVGDELEINTKDGTYTSYVLQRQLSGIQNLQDRYINGTLDIF